MNIAVLSRGLLSRIVDTRLITKYPFFKDFNLDSKTVFLFNNADPFVRTLVSAFIFQLMESTHETSFITNWYTLMIFYNQSHSVLLQFRLKKTVVAVIDSVCRKMIYLIPFNVLTNAFFTSQLKRLMTWVHTFYQTLLIDKNLYPKSINIIDINQFNPPNNKSPLCSSKIWNGKLILTAKR